MYILLIFLIMMSLILGVSNHVDEEKVHVESGAAAIGAALVTYNSAILKQCASGSYYSGTGVNATGFNFTCNPGEIQLQTYPLYLKNTASLYIDNFHAIYDASNHRLITVFIPSVESYTFKGEVSVLLRGVDLYLTEKGNESAYMGAWHESNQSVYLNKIYSTPAVQSYPLDNPNSYITHSQNVTQQVSAGTPTVMVPQGTGGYQFVDGTPMIITNFAN